MNIVLGPVKQFYCFAGPSSNDTVEMLRGAEYGIPVCLEQLPEQPPSRLFRKLFKDYYLKVSDSEYRVQE